MAEESEEINTPGLFISSCLRSCMTVEWLQLHLKFPDFLIILFSLFHVQGREAARQREEGNSLNSVELSM